MFFWCHGETSWTRLTPKMIWKVFKNDIHTWKTLTCCLFQVSARATWHMTHHQRCWRRRSADLAAGPWCLRVARCGRLIPQWSQGCLEACCVWSLSGHFNISPRPRVGPHVAPAITGGSPSSFLLPPSLPPSAALPHPAAAAVCHFVVSTKVWPLTVFFFHFVFLPLHFYLWYLI